MTELFAEVSHYGVASVKRAYGDWTTPNLKSWKDTLHKMAIQPIQQFRYTTGKNATDSSMIIDAMDLLHAGNLEGFCLVSSDSDFTRLATRIREAGLLVYGFGEKHTPAPFVATCDKFIYTEILKAETAPIASTKEAQSSLESMLRAAVEAADRDNGWARLAAVGNMLLKLSPSFDPRNYGFKKLGELVKGQPFLEIMQPPQGADTANVHLYVRLRE